MGGGKEKTIKQTTPKNNTPKNTQRTEALPGDASSSSPTATSAHTSQPVKSAMTAAPACFEGSASADPQTAGAEADAATFLAGLLRVIFDVEKCLVLFSALMFALGTWTATSLCSAAPRAGPHGLQFAARTALLLQRPLCNIKRAPWLFWQILSSP